MAIIEYYEDEERGAVQQRGTIQIFKVLAILDPATTSNIGGGIVAEKLDGERILLGSSQKFNAFRAKKRFGPSGLRGLTNEEKRAWSDEFYQQLMWPSSQKDNDIREKEDYVYAELVDNGHHKEVKGYGLLRSFNINDGFRVFARGEKEKQSRGNAPDRINPKDEILIGYARIIRETSREDGIVVEMVSDPKIFQSWNAARDYLLHGVSMECFNGNAICMSAFDDLTGRNMKGNYFPPKITGGKTTDGTSKQEIMDDIQMMMDRGIEVDSVLFYETTKAFLDSSSWKKEGKSLNEFMRTIFFVYHHDPKKISLDVNSVETFNPSGGKSRKKGPPSHMIRGAVSRTVYKDPKHPELPARPARVRAFIPFDEGDIVSSLNIYMSAKQKQEVVLRKAQELEAPKVEVLEQSGPIQFTTSEVKHGA